MIGNLALSKNNDSQPDQPRLVLEGLWRDIKAKADAASSFAADISRVSAGLSDAADLGMEAAKCGYSYGDWESSIETANRLNLVLNELSGVKQTWQRLGPAVSTAGTAAISASGSLVTGTYSDGLPPEEQVHICHVQEGYSEFFQRMQIRDEVLRLMAACGFAPTNYGRLAIEKFIAAWETYEQKPATTDPAIGSLLALRESIRLTIDELLRRRPMQREAKRNKIKDIGEQLRYTQVSADVFEDLQNDYRPLNDCLSISKDQVLPRNEETERMRKGTYYLLTLLNAIDPEKLR